MSQNRPPKKKVVVTTKTEKSGTPKTPVKKVKPSSSRKAEVKVNELLFGRTTYLIMGIGVILIGLGFVLMSGGAMPSPDVWDDSIIYSPVRTVLAPILILAGLGIQIYAIFKKDNKAS